MCRQCGLCGYFGEEIDRLQIFQPIAKSLSCALPSGLEDDVKTNINNQIKSKYFFKELD